MTNSEVGQYKLVTLGTAADELESFMFDYLDDAKTYAAKLDTYIICQFVQSSNGNYTWRILPYGDYRLYQVGVFVKKYWPLILIAILLSIYGISHYFFKKRSLEPLGMPPVGAPAPPVPAPVPIPSPSPAPAPEFSL